MIKVIKKNAQVETKKVSVKAPVKTTEQIVKSWITETQVSKMEAQVAAKKFWGIK